MLDDVFPRRQQLHTGRNRLEEANGLLLVDDTEPRHTGLAKKLLCRSVRLPGLPELALITVNLALDAVGDCLLVVHPQLIADGDRTLYQTDSVVISAADALHVRPVCKDRALGFTDREAVQFGRLGNSITRLFACVVSMVQMAYIAIIK